MDLACTMLNLILQSVVPMGGRLALAICKDEVPALQTAISSAHDAEAKSKGLTTHNQTKHPKAIKNHILQCDPDPDCFRFQTQVTKV